MKLDISPVTFLLGFNPILQEIILTLVTSLVTYPMSLFRTQKFFGSHINPKRIKPITFLSFSISSAPRVETFYIGGSPAGHPKRPSWNWAILKNEIDNILDKSKQIQQVQCNFTPILQNLLKKKIYFSHCFKTHTFSCLTDIQRSSKRKICAENSQSSCMVYSGTASVGNTENILCQ